ncbi:histidine kinase [Pseudenhygromyxa sp. WMMC2535]|uniref:sensor histidine kinase n=1 Tax=Pseudenhygromyxa sp. WMMC2535 TaxID=2712867 RepID=UPI0015548578|nr:histidine kinase [Pseudenhygromyxa sp. WMMC2535]NVB40664.1 histidine kinase [Pseudenhygromyxa sp. WMMC2535]
MASAAELETDARARPFWAALLVELRRAWWIYALVPVVLTALGAADWGVPTVEAFALNFCVTLCIGGSSQAVFLLAERRGFGLPLGLHYPLLVLAGVALGTELALASLRLFAGFDPAMVRRGLWVVGGIVAAVVAAISVTYDRLRERARAVELRAEQARRQALEAKLDALQSRMNPHFLFNSLNTVAALIEEDRDAAVLAVERLSELLRYTLERSGDTLVPLADELRCVREYLALEGARFGERLRVRVDIDEALARVTQVMIPPLIIQPLVENAVKHGVARSRAPVTVCVAVDAEGEGLRVAVSDDGPGAHAGPSAGTGTAQRTVSERLRLLYGEAARFEAGPLSEGGYRATLHLPRAPRREVAA